MEHEATLYYVQSPSTNPRTLQEELEEASRAFFTTTLSYHFSSSSCTTITSTTIHDDASHGEKGLIIVDAAGSDEDVDDDGYYGMRRRGGEWWKRSCTYRDTDSWAWIFIQISWRAMLSLWVALLVFYVITKPPPPKVSIEGPKLYVEPGSTKIKLYVGARTRAMYGAGRSMEDKLESHEGLPLVVQVKLRSSFQVVWKLIKTKFHLQARCSVLLRQAYDKKHRTQVFNSSCVIT